MFYKWRLIRNSVPSRRGGDGKREMKLPATLSRAAAYGTLIRTFTLPVSATVSWVVGS